VVSDAYSSDLRTSGREKPLGRHLSSVPASLSSDPHDNDGSPPRWGALGTGDGNGSGVAPPVGNLHYRRLDLKPTAHTIHDAGDLSRIRSSGQTPGPVACLKPPAPPSTGWRVKS